jgi:intracellular sulfur oxidation DsrE/DsrF family protein
MNRRGVFHGALAAAAGWIGAARAAAGEDRAPMKVVYHLSDFEKADFVLHNMRVHYENAGGPITIALVVHGPAVRAFRQDGSGVTRERLAALLKRGLTPYVCAVALRGQNMEEKDLAPGILITQAGTVRLAEMQREGYFYLRP